MERAAPFSSRGWLRSPAGPREHGGVRQVGWGWQGSGWETGWVLRGGRRALGAPPGSQPAGGTPPGMGHLWESGVPGGCPSPALAPRALLTHPGAEPGPAQARRERMNRFRPGPSWFLRRGPAASSLPAAHPSHRG